MSIDIHAIQIPWEPFVAHCHESKVVQNLEALVSEKRFSEASEISHALFEPYLVSAFDEGNALTLYTGMMGEFATIYRDCRVYLEESVRREFDLTMGNLAACFEDDLGREIPRLRLAPELKPLGFGPIAFAFDFAACSKVAALSKSRNVEALRSSVMNSSRFPPLLPGPPNPLQAFVRNLPQEGRDRWNDCGVMVDGWIDHVCDAASKSCGIFAIVES